MKMMKNQKKNQKKKRNLKSSDINGFHTFCFKLVVLMYILCLLM